jgi:hypothetical protein
MSEVQSIVFNKNNFDLEKSLKWLMEHDFKINKVDEKENSFRFRQQDPKKYKKFITKSPSRGVNLIIGFK